MTDFKEIARQVRSAQEDMGALAQKFQGMTDVDLIAFADKQDEIAAKAEWSADMARTELNLRELRRAIAGVGLSESQA